MVKTEDWNFPSPPSFFQALPIQGDAHWLDIYADLPFFSNKRYEVIWGEVFERNIPKFRNGIIWRFLLVLGGLISLVIRAEQAEERTRQSRG